MADIRPSVLLIVTDQHRHDFVGYRGAHWLRTPNMDRIAGLGVAFTHCYVNSPVCGPARCALATGKQPHRIGCLTNADALPLSHRTFYQQLRDHNYWTGFVGKLDLAKVALDFPGGGRAMRSDGASPEHFAFGFCQPVEIVAGMAGDLDRDRLFGRHLQHLGLLEQWVADRKSRIPRESIVAVSNFSHGRVDLRHEAMPPGWVRDVCHDSPLPAEAHADVFVGEQSVRWLEEVPTVAPWFLQVNFMGPHDPFDPPREYADRCRDADVPEPIPAEYAGKPEWVARRFITDDPEQIRFSRRQYSAMVEMIDHQIGRMLDVLERRDMLDSTIVIFTADHGEMLGDFGLYIKHVPYEASARVPLAMFGPGIPSGRTADALVEWIDLNPTICELAGVPPLERTDAKSLLPVLRDPSRRHRETVLCCEQHFRSLRDARWKLVLSQNDVTELYDLDADPQEMQNLAAGGRRECASEARRLSGLMARRMAEGGWLR